MSIILFSCEQNKNILSTYISNDYKILYNSEGDIFIMDGNGRNKKNLTYNFGGSSFVSNSIGDVSSDGQKIIFNQSVTDTVNWETKYTTYIMDITGENKKSLSNTSLIQSNPKFSPDGQYIVFDAKENFYDIYIMNSDGSNVRNLTTDSYRDRYPQFSPDGLKIIYISDRNIFSINFDGTNKTNLTNDGNLCNASFCISSDGSKIVYISCKDGQSNIYTMNIDGTNQKKITNTAGNQNPSFSYDNSKIAYISWSISGYDIKIIDIDGQNEKIIASTKRPRNDYWRPIALFSPDDENILFTSYNDGNMEIYSVDIHGKYLKNLTNSPNEDYLGIVLAIN